MSLEFKQYLVFGSTFEVTERYSTLVPIGVGASGLVCSAKDERTDRNVAIKKVSFPFSSALLAKRTYREMRLLKYLTHENVISLMDSFISPNDDIYLVTELLGTDLQCLLSSGVLERKHIQYFLYQIMRGLKYVHSAGVVHRDLKPGNILVNENCEIKICDFGLARMVNRQMTEYYRAPEIMLSQNMYNECVDIWSSGCILAEMILGRPLFLSMNYSEHFSMIIDLLGMPTDDYLDSICNEKTKKLVKSLPKKEKRDLSIYFPNCTLDEIEILEKTLSFDVRKRPTAAEVLEMNYMREYHDINDEPTADRKFDWSFTENSYSADVLRSLIYKEVEDFPGAS